MQINLKKITLTNFKGARNFSAGFGSTTNILGRNGSGKTTILDAFLWTLFGKDSTDRTAFEIKTLDENNEAYHRLDHEVELQLNVDGESITIKRSYREKWVKKAGSADAQFSGHTNDFTWNDVPLSEKEFQIKISRLINEKQFKLLTNLSYFNTVLKWQDRRQLLIELAGGLSDIEVADSINADGSYSHLVKALLAKKTLEEYRKEIAAKIKKIKEDSDTLPARISEANRSLPESIDYSAVEKQLAALQQDLQSVDEMLTNQSAGAKQHQQTVMSLLREQGTLKQEVLKAEEEIKQSVRDQRQVRENRLTTLRREAAAMSDERNGIASTYTAKNRELTRVKDELATWQSQIDKVRSEYDTLEAEKFQLDPNACVCPACKQDLPNALERSAELEANWNQSKSSKLSLIRKRGQDMKTQIDEAGKRIETLEAELSNLTSQGTDKAAMLAAKNQEILTFEEQHQRMLADEKQQAREEIAGSPVIMALSLKVDALQARIDAPYEADDNTELKARKANLTAEISSLDRQLAGKGQREKILSRIQDLQKQEQESSQQLVELEGLQFSLLQFDKAKMDLIEERINDKFELVRFRLFDRQVNGGETASCVTLINGVPYPDANTASKINASLDIIRVFSDHFKVKAPVFIDNRESVTDIIDTDFQVINLIVSPEHKKLTVQSEAEAFA